MLIFSSFLRRKEKKWINTNTNIKKRKEIYIYIYKDECIRDKFPVFDNTNRIVSIYRIFRASEIEFGKKRCIESALIEIVLNEVLLYFIVLYQDLDSYTNGTETVRLFLILSLSLIPYTKKMR